MEGKSSLKWCRLANEDFGQERYVKEFGSKGEVRQIFRLRMDGISMIPRRQKVVWYMSGW